jgi:hypothetical protein
LFAAFHGNWWLQMLLPIETWKQLKIKISNFLLKFCLYFEGGQIWSSVSFGYPAKNIQLRFKLDPLTIWHLNPSTAFFS